MPTRALLQLQHTHHKPHTHYALPPPGFAENQQYGLGTNSMTGGQKSLLIYGTLLVFVALFLSGYALE